MNSLEKLIQDLKDSKNILADRRFGKLSPTSDDGVNMGDNQQDIFIENAIQGAINRLEALNEELESAE
jgi:hypothetical protein